MIPRLETERLVMREWRHGDLDAFAPFLADEEVVRYLSGTTSDRNESWRNIATSAGHWLLRGYGTWAVERKFDGALIGKVGLIYPEGWPGLEVGWTLGRAYWGQGYATESARAAMNYGFLTQGVDKLLSLINVDNTNSQRVAERLGETRGPEHDLVVAGKVHKIHIWSITREEWRKRAVLP